MSVALLTSEKELQAYDAWLQHHPEGNFWQSLERKSYVEARGEHTRLYALRENGEICCAALVVIDTTVGGMSTWEIPRGPVWNADCSPECLHRLLDTIIDDAQQQKCIALYLSPQKELPHLPISLKHSNRHVHCQATRILDVTSSETDILAQMKQKGRYNIRLAGKRGVSAEISEDIESFTQLVTKTASRDAFISHQPQVYKTFYENLEESFLIMSYHPEKPTIPIAGLLGVLWNGQGIYYYGASDHTYRNLMAPYKVQWKAIQYCKEKGARTYDLLGVAPMHAPANHPWQGISAFKEKLGGTYITYPAERVVLLRSLPFALLWFKRMIFG